MFTDIELDYLDGQPLGRLATVQPDGTVQVNPVGFAIDPDRGVVDIGGFNMASSRKYRNVADNGRVALVVDDIASTSPWRVRFLEVRGRADAIADPRSTRYRHVDGPIIRIHPDRILSMALYPGELDLEPHDVPKRSRSIRRS